MRRLARPHRGRATAARATCRDVERHPICSCRRQSGKDGWTDPRITGSGMQPGPCVAGRPASHACIRDQDAPMRRIETSHHVAVEPSLSSVLPQACRRVENCGSPGHTGAGLRPRGSTCRDVERHQFVLAENSTAGKGISSFSLAPARAPFTSTSDTEADVSGRFMRPAQAGGRGTSLSMEGSQPA